MLPSASRLIRPYPPKVSKVTLWGSCGDWSSRQAGVVDRVAPDPIVDFGGVGAGDVLARCPDEPGEVDRAAGASDGSVKVNWLHRVRGTWPQLE